MVVTEFGNAILINSDTHLDFCPSINPISVVRYISTVRETPDVNIRMG